MTKTKTRAIDKYTVVSEKGLRVARKNFEGKREESARIAEQTKEFLENGGKIEVHEQDFCKDVSKIAYGYQKLTQ
mgnify:CR=1 FL=1